MKTQFYVTKCMKMWMMSLLLTCIGFSSYAAKSNFVLGKPSAEEMAMKVYPEDTSAAAVVLYKECTILPQDEEDFISEKVVRCRMKILKEIGKEFITLEIPYTHNIYLTDFKAVITNVVDGKVQTSVVKRNELFDELSTDNFQRKKIAFKDLRVGSIIDYEYVMQINYIISYQPYSLQDDMPVRYSHYLVQAPNLIKYRQNILSWYPIESRSDFTTVRGVDFVEYEYTAKNLPALKREPYVWNYQDYMASIELNIKTIDVSIPQKIAGTWSAFDKSMEENDGFGKIFEQSGRFADDVSAFKTDTNEISKISSILRMIRSKLKYDNQTTKYVDDLSKALREKEGSSAEMNAALILALKDAGFIASPILINSRKYGRVPVASPTHYVFNKFVVGVETNQGTLVMDASMDGAQINLLKENDIVPFGRYMLPTGPKWLDLTKIVSPSVKVLKYDMKFNESGQLSGTLTTQLTGLERTNILDDLQGVKLEDHKKQWESRNRAKIKSYALEGCGANDFLIKEKIDFVNPNVVTGDTFLYLTPGMERILEEQPLKASTRVLPIEFSYPYNYVIIAIIDIPQNYDVEEMPRRVQLPYEQGKDLNFEYIPVKSGNKIISRITLQMNGIQYSQTNYAALRDFFSKVLSTSQQKIILKKKA